MSSKLHKTTSIKFKTGVYYTYNITGLKGLRLPSPQTHTHPFASDETTDNTGHRTAEKICAGNLEKAQF